MHYWKPEVVMEMLIFLVVGIVLGVMLGVSLVLILDTYDAWCARHPRRRP
jgi:hypothetical protein